MVEAIPSILQNSKLYEYTNAAAGDGFFEIPRYTQGIKNAPAPDVIVHSTKRFGVMVLPDLKVSDANYNFYLPKDYGCQFVCPHYHNRDDHLVEYEAHYNNSMAKTSFLPLADFL